jgi:hypothetical protein
VQNRTNLKISRASICSRAAPSGSSRPFARRPGPAARIVRRTGCGDARRRPVGSRGTAAGPRIPRTGQQSTIVGVTPCRTAVFFGSERSPGSQPAVTAHQIENLPDMRNLLQAERFILPRPPASSIQNFRDLAITVMTRQPVDFSGRFRLRLSNPRDRQWHGESQETTIPGGECRSLGTSEKSWGNAREAWAGTLSKFAPRRISGAAAGGRGRRYPAATTPRRPGQPGPVASAAIFIAFGERNAIVTTGRCVRGRAESPGRLEAARGDGSVENPGKPSWVAKRQRKAGTSNPGESRRPSSGCGPVPGPW